VIIRHDEGAGWVYPDVAANLEFGADHQLGALVDVHFDAVRPYSYMSLRGTTQEIGNLSTGRNPTWAVLQNYEDISQGSGAGHLIINQDQNLTYSGFIRNSWTRNTNAGDPLKITKKGEGTLVISTGSKNTGGIDVLEGTLQIGDGNARGALLNNNPVYIGAEGTLKYYRTDRQHVEGVIRIGHDISGDGTLIFASNNWNSNDVGVFGAGDYRYTGTNTLSADANFIIDNARLVVFEQADLGPICPPSKSSTTVNCTWVRAAPIPTL
jgi:autotransporter-associated beta strand protein